MARPKTLHEDTKTYNLTIPIILFDRLERISKIETENDIRHISIAELIRTCLLYTSPSPRDVEESRMPSSA